MSLFERFRGSSKAFLVCILFIQIFYALIILLQILKRKGDKEVSITQKLSIYAMAIWGFRILL